MSHTMLASNTLVITEDVAPSEPPTSVYVAVYPSSVSSGAVTITTKGADGVALLSLDDVVALRDHLNVCIEQASAANVKGWTVALNDVDELVTKCPHCGTLDSIREVDTASRWNTLEPAEDGMSAVAYISDTGDWEGDGWICDACLSRALVEPSGFTISVWL